jgi:hypothetical protein
MGGVGSSILNLNKIAKKRGGKIGMKITHFLNN